MNKGLVFVLGASLGAIGGYLIGDVINYKLEERMFTEEDEVVIDEKSATLIAKVDPIVVGNLYKEAEKETELPRRDYTKYAKNRELLDELAAQYSGELEADEDEEGILPYVISLSEWQALSAEEDDYEDKQVVLFYPDAMAFVLQDGLIPVPDPTTSFGPNVSLKFGEQSEDDDVVYIWDPELNAAYEIIRMTDGNYRTDVLGEPEEEPKEKARPKRRKRAAKSMEEKDNNDDSESPPE